MSTVTACDLLTASALNCLGLPLFDGARARDWIEGDLRLPSISLWTRFDHSDDTCPCSHACGRFSCLTAVAVASVMETSLHRQLKEIYADGESQLEAPLEKFRIDVVCGGELVEIQHGSLAAIRDKVTKLLKTHRVLVVKPIVSCKWIVRQDARGGHVLGRRRSPKQESVLDVFHELVYFTRVFPHANLALEVPLVEIEEWRYPGHGRRRRWRANDYQVEDQKLLRVDRVHRFRSGGDLIQLLPVGLPSPFHTGHLASRCGISRWFAQRIAYCLRKMNLVEEAGKEGNARLYRLPMAARQAA